MQHLASSGNFKIKNTCVRVKQQQRQHIIYNNFTQVLKVRNKNNFELLIVKQAVQGWG